MANSKNESQEPKSFSEKIGAVVESVLHSAPAADAEQSAPPVPSEQAPKAQEKKSAKSAHIKNVKHETSGPCPGDYVDRTPKTSI